MLVSAAASAGLPERADAGTGTQSDPWLYNINVWWNPAVGSGTFTGISDTIQPVTVNPTTFWAVNPRFTGTGGFYGGLQTNTILHGSSGGGTASRGAAFSLFGIPLAYRIIDTAHCDNGADGGAGVSCSIPYSWLSNTKYRLQMTAVGVTQPSGGTQYCNGGAGSQCTVWTGYVAPNSNPSATTQIGKWSTQSPAYGFVGQTVHFQENFGSPCGPRLGYMTPPSYDYSASSAVSNFATGSNGGYSCLSQSWWSTSQSSIQEY